MYGGLSNLGYDRSCKVVSIMKSRTLQQVLLLPPCRHKGNKRTVHRILGGNLKVEPIRAKWYTEEETGILDHQPMQGKIDNNSEEENKECSSTSGAVDTLKAQDPEQRGDCENIFVIADKKSPKRPRRQPVTRKKEFLWTDINKN